jgi:hypothetical protein
MCVIVVAYVRDLPQGWYFITFCPATNANKITKDDDKNK